MKRLLSQLSFKELGGDLLLNSGLLRPALHRHKAIFMLHRITAEPVPRWQQALAVQQEDFEQWIKWLRRHFELVDLETCLSAEPSQSWRRKPLVSITFDDGWKDNVSLAFPVLERLKVPASIFLATGFIGTQRRFWWDTLGCALWNPTPATTAVLRETAHTLSVPTPPSLAGSEQDRWLQLHRWLEELKQIPADIREALADAVADDVPHGMTPNEVHALEDSGLIRFGAHSVSHALLDQLDAESLQAEVEGSIASVRRWCRRPLPVFCYPNGSENQLVRDAVRASGVRWALATGNGLVKPDTDPFAVPRINVPSNMAARPGLLGFRLARALTVSNL